MNLNLFYETLQTDCEGLDLCVRIAAREIAVIQRPRSPFYEPNEIDAKRNAERVDGLKRYIRECGLRKEGNLETMEAGNGKCLARIHEIGNIDFMVEANRPRDYAATGVWPARQFVPGPEPYERAGLAEIDAMIQRIEAELEVLTRVEP